MTVPVRLRLWTAAVGGRTWDDLNGFVRRNPMPSLLIAFGLGWCMGQFLTSNRS